MRKVLFLAVAVSLSGISVAGVILEAERETTGVSTDIHEIYTSMGDFQNNMQLVVLEAHWWADSYFYVQELSLDPNEGLRYHEGTWLINFEDLNMLFPESLGIQNAEFMGWLNGTTFCLGCSVRAQDRKYDLEFVEVSYLGDGVFDLQRVSDEPEPAEEPGGYAGLMELTETDITIRAELRELHYGPVLSNPRANSDEEASGRQLLVCTINWQEEPYFYVQEFLLEPYEGMSVPLGTYILDKEDLRNLLPENYYLDTIEFSGWLDAMTFVLTCHFRNPDFGDDNAFFEVAYLGDGVFSLTER